MPTRAWLGKPDADVSRLSLCDEEIAAGLILHRKRIFRVEALRARVMLQQRTGAETRRQRIGDARRNGTCVNALGSVIS
jgi:hypothetical protein